MQKWAVWLGGLLPFEHAEDVLNTVGQMPMSDSTLWRQVQVWGERGRNWETRQRAEARALPARSQIVPGEVPQATVKGVALDGATVKIREEGWKELKVESVFEVEVRPTRDRETGDLIDLAHAVHNTHVAHLGGHTPEAQRWFKAYDTTLFEGHADQKMDSIFFIILS